jgi:hypothetical protein
MAQQVSWQEYQTLSIRSAAILTNAYVAATVIGQAQTTTYPMTADHVEQCNFLALECAFTLGSLTNVTLKIEFSDDNSTFYQIGVGTITTGTDAIVAGLVTLTATGNYYIDINKECFNGGGFKTRFIKVSASGVGTVTGSSLAINAVWGVA